MISLPCSAPVRSSHVSAARASRTSRGFAWTLAHYAAIAIALAVSCNVGQAQQSLQVLQHHVRSQVSKGQAALLGALAPDQKLNLSIVLPLRNQAALTSLLSRLYDPASPDYRKFLTVAQFTDQFGPTKQDYQSVVSFAQANGFVVTGAPANRFLVPISGSVSQINKAFNVKMNSYRHPTENRAFFSPDREPSLNLSVPITHIAGLNNYSIPHSMLKRPQTALQNSDIIGSGPNGSYLGSDMRAAYYGGTTLDGTGQAVGLLEFDGYFLSDVNLTFSRAGQTYGVPINNVLLDGATGEPSSEDAEEVLDIVQAIGMAPGLSQVRVYIGSGLDDVNILNSMASENIAKQLSCSWSWIPDDPQTDDPIFEEFAAQGQSFFVASGDEGAFDAAISPFFYPGDDVYVTTVGGTHLTTSGAAGSWASETAWNAPSPDGFGTGGSGGGISPDSIPIPSWQTGVANTSNAGSSTLRNVPDVAMEADFDNYFCEEGDCGYDGAGTSFAAPRWAGFMALVNQQAIEAGTAPQGGVGFINPAIYSIGLGSNYGNDFHDITSGNNETDNQPVWYSAVTGYDLVTGWGSANGQHLIDDLAGAQVPGFWIESSSGNISIPRGNSAATTITVSDAGGFSGNVTLALTSTLPTGVTASWGTNPTSGSSVLTLTASSSAAAGSTTLTITGTSGSLTATTTVVLTIQAPSFMLTGQGSINVGVGSYATSYIWIYDQDGFAGNVNLSVSGLPSGVTAAFSPNPASGSSILTLTASSSAAPGTTMLTITGTSGSLTATTTQSLEVCAPTFTLSSPGTVNIGLGGSSNAFVQVFPQYGFAGSVTLSVSGLPSGITALWSPNPTSGSSMLSLTASNSVATGQYPVTITGKSGGLTVSTSFSLGVYAPTFTLSGGGPVSIGQGGSGSTSIWINSQYGFSGSVNLSVSGLPSGVTASFSPNPSAGGSTLTLSASSSVPVGQYPLTVTGTSGTQSATTALTLGVFAPTFTLSSWGSVTMGQGTSTTAYVYVTSQYGFAGSINLSVSGLPSGVTASFTPNPTTGSSMMTLIASSVAALGQANLTITGTSGSQTASTQLTLGVFLPTFSLYAGGSVNIGQGTSATTYVGLNAQYGFSGIVNLSLSGLPDGVTASIAPNPTTGSSTLTFVASSTASLGQFNVTITGTCGTQTATTTLSVGVYVPTFTLSASSAAVGQGNSTTSWIWVNDQYGFGGNVNLSISGLPPGVTASFSPNPTAGSSTLTLTASTTAIIGQYNLTITGTSGGQTASTTVPLGVYAPTFNLYGSGSVTLDQGGTESNSYISVSSQFGFSGNVTLSASGLPAGVTVSFSPNPTAATSTMTFTATDSATPGTAAITITGVSGGLTSTMTVSLTIVASTFNLSAAPAQVHLLPGASTSASIAIITQTGFSSSVNLSATGLPSGVTASFSPNPTSTGASVLTLTAADSAVPGTGVVTISGTSGNLNAATPLTVTVRGAPPVTTTTLAVISSGSPVTSVAAGTVVSLTAAVNSGSAALTSGTVMFCDATAPECDQAQNIGSAELTSAGSAVLKFIPGIGTHTYKAAFAGSNAQAASSSDTSNLTVTDALVSSTTLIQGGSAGNYLLTASVTGHGLLAPGGKVSFLDTSNGSSVLATAALEPRLPALSWVIPQSPATGAEPSFIAVGDFNGDGIPDLAVANQTSNTLTILLGNGDGTFKTANANLPNGNNPSFVAVGDFDGDGKADLAVANANGNNLSILLGKGDGTFNLSSSNPPTGSFPHSIAVGDFNGDGIQDLAVVNLYGNTLTILLGNGDGTFTPSNLSPQTGSGPESVVTGDFNQDGILDLAVANASDSTVTILLGNGDGSFTVAASAPTGYSPVSIAIGDFDQDGKLDLAIANSGGQTITILLGNGDGTFTATSASPQAGYQPTSVAVADFNGDGHPDLAVANGFGDTVTILLGNGDGTFVAGKAQGTGTDSVAVAVGDFNGDGIPDLAVANFYSSTLSILAAQLAQTSTASADHISPLGQGTHAVSASYPGDNNYQSSVSGTAGLTAQSIKPTITMVPSLSILTSAQPLMVTIAVSSGTGGPVPTGLLTLSSGTYTAQQNLASGSASFSLPAGSLPAGTDTITALYTPDASGAVDYIGATQSIQVTVTVIGNLTPIVTVAPSASVITDSQSMKVAVTVAGASGQAIPTGAVNLSSGSYSASQTLSSGAATFTLAAGTLTSGANTFTAAYSGDANYGAASGTTTVTVSSVAATVAPPASVSAGATASAVVTLAAGSTYSGTMNLTCALTASPTGAQSLPQCSLNPSNLTLTNGATGTTSLTMTTTAASTTSAMKPLHLGIWGFGCGGSVLAIVLMFGVPSRRRASASRFLLLWMIVAATAIGCGGGGGQSSGSTTHPTTPATTSGNYTFTVTATDSANSKITTTASVTLAVQ